LDEARKALLFRSRHDPVTRLANRAAVLDEIALADGDGATPDGIHDVTVVHVDLDGFKRINDALGHAAGDALLCHVASGLKASLPPTTTIARVGPDDFECDL